MPAKKVAVDWVEGSVGGVGDCVGKRGCGEESDCEGGSDVVEEDAA